VHSSEGEHGPYGGTNWRIKRFKTLLIHLILWKENGLNLAYSAESGRTTACKICQCQSAYPNRSC